MKRVLLLCVALLGVFVVCVRIHPGLASAQDAGGVVGRYYHYLSINDTITVNADSTIRVEEDQLYDFVGTYHLGWRSIPHNGYDVLTDISVIDGTGVPLEYSRSRLNKDDPASWGKYTTFEKNGETDIEWYYNLSDTTHHFVVSYTVHGAISFAANRDELYWNLFTSYLVPVDSVEATIHLPGVVTTPAAAFYTSGTHAYVSDRPDTSSFHFSTTNISPNEAVTIAVGWQKGLVSQSAYWWDALHMYWEIVAGIAVLFATALFTIFYWFYEERKYHGHGTIIPQYEPPENLPPAMAAVVCGRGLAPTVWSATVVDLAVRGFVTIEEISGTKLFGLFATPTSYTLHKVQKQSEGALRPYEEKFMDALFPLGQTVLSMEELQGMGHQSDRQKLVKAIDHIGDDLFNEVQGETHAFLINPDRSYEWWKHASVGFVLLLILLKLSPLFMLFGSSIQIPFTFSNMFFVGSLVAAAVVLVYLFYFRRELNTQGHILKEEWLGFKLFLSVTGKDRMQNLTPDMFEKYLPYAMIFGVEKEWAKKFESLSVQVPSPNWYVGSQMSSAGVQTGFSPSSFAGGFSASFASSFAQSGGGGASGGGGGAGGGGGGGGGGAA